MKCPMKMVRADRSDTECEGPSCMWFTTYWQSERTSTITCAVTMFAARSAAGVHAACFDREERRGEQECR